MKIPIIALLSAADRALGRIDPHDPLWNELRSAVEAVRRDSQVEAFAALAAPPSAQEEKPCKGKPHPWVREPNVVDEQGLHREVERCSACGTQRSIIISPLPPPPAGA